MIVYTGEELQHYSWGDDHPFGPDRYRAFLQRFLDSGLDRLTRHGSPRRGSEADLLLFHTREYVALVQALSAIGEGMLDPDTPVFPGIYETALGITGTVLDAVERLCKGEDQAAFIPVAGLHHAQRDHSAGFCVFNDCGIAIEALRQRHGIQRIAYIDIDAHHGDGVYYGFETDPDVIIADFHEDGRFLYPGTGHITETGSGGAEGTKLNIPLPPEANDQLFARLWPEAEKFIRKFKPEFLIVQCGADSIAGDPITHLALSEASHKMAVASLWKLARELCQGRLLLLGGGGYNLKNIATTWNTVIATVVALENALNAS